MAFRIVRKVSTRGEVREKILTVSGDLLRIGRGALNELQLEDLAVSLNHAEMRRDEQGFYTLRNVSQGQTIYLNHGPVSEAVLQPGDVVTIQHYQLSVAQPDSSGQLVLSVEEGAVAPVELSPALMPRLVLSSGRWTKWRIATLLAILVSGGSILGTVVGQGTFLMPGDVSIKHAKFASQCETCHTSVKPVWNFVDNATCQTCHRPDILPPSHFKQDVALSAVPACASCHLEHKGQKVLADVSDLKCVQCHAELKAKGQAVPSIAAVHGFSTDHPEFAITRSQLGRGDIVRVRLNDTERLKDDGRLKLNHSLHLTLGDRYLDAVNRKPLTCSDCHHMDDEGRFMRPVSFQRDCFSCHSNEVDLAPIKPGRQVTHGRQLEVLRVQLDQIFSGEYLQVHPEEAQKPDVLRWIPGRRLPGQPQTPYERYVVDGRAEAEKLLLSPKVKKCLKCHEAEDVIKDVAMGTDGAGRSGPSLDGTESQEGDVVSRVSAAPAVQGEMGKSKRIVPVNVPIRWLPYNRFDHQAHAAIPDLRTKGQGNWCLPCHENTVNSVKSDDVLLPSITLCRTCHFEPGGAQASCNSCHEFHVSSPSPAAPSTNAHAQSVQQSSSYRAEELPYV